MLGDSEKVEPVIIELKPKCLKSKDSEMVLSSTSSLESPEDSGVQMLDSECSEITSVMSNSGIGCDLIDRVEEDKPEVSKSDIVNQNIQYKNYFDKFRNKNFVEKSFSQDDVFEMEHPIKDDLMNVSLNSYELLDYTQQNKELSPDKNEQMHVSMSEEVNENLKVTLSNQDVVLTAVEEKPNDEEQIVFRRQRRKKSKSDTPKKRVSFHEDILNSTKIDDIHINHGFITIEPDVSLNFFQRGFLKKPDVVKGRYSWAAEGDAPFYEKTDTRNIKSDIYVQQTRFSSSSSSGSCSSVDEDEEYVKKEPTFTEPKSSCLKKIERKKIETKIVEEARKKSENPILDANIFGSLKNILNFSTSVPLAERGVPEGQEDVTIYSSSDYRKKPYANSFIASESIKKIAPKNNLKLTKSEGFYPNYPTNHVLPTNVILCDSNVYEHKGISYSYEYDKFQKSFETTKSKNSSIYQNILREFNFFKRSSKQTTEEEFEIVPSESIEEVEEVDTNSFRSSTKLEWPDDITEASSKHLSSPKHRNPNHYSSPAKLPGNNPISKLKPSTSKTLLINRFLRSITTKKVLNKTQTQRRKFTDLYIRGINYKYNGKDEVDLIIENEMKNAKRSEGCDKNLMIQLRREIFRNKFEILLKTFSVRSAYNTKGQSQPLLVVLTNTTLYISGTNSKNKYCNHFVLPYTELDTILIGPNAQTIFFSNYDKDMKFSITTGCSSITSSLIGQLEFAMRKDSNKPKLPAVKEMCMEDMHSLKMAICKQTSVSTDEEYFYYSIVDIQDSSSDLENTPLGPNKEGPLMFKTGGGDRWETAYFILKGGVMYMLSSASQRVPMRVFPLMNGSCQGARRVFNYPRPHTFQLIIEGTNIYLAAPNEYVASEWLQCLIHAASGTYNSHQDKLATQSCSLILSHEHILAVREAFPASSMGELEDIKAKVLSCAAITDLVAFRLPSAEQSWCILEFSCREVHECSGDWIFYFCSNAELEKFISTLEMLWNYCNEDGDSFPLSTIPETDPLSKRCVNTYTQLRNSWPSNVVHLQFL